MSLTHLTQIFNWVGSRLAQIKWVIGELIGLGKNCHLYYIQVLLYSLRNYTICRVCFIQLKLKSQFPNPDLFPLLLERVKVCKTICM